MQEYNSITEGDAPQKSNTKSSLLLVLLIISVLANGLLLYFNNSQKNLIENTNAALISSEKLKSELETQYNQALTDLEQQRVGNKMLDEQIDGMKAELKTSKDRISRLLVDSKNYASVKKEMESMKVQADGYVAELTKLKSENEELYANNNALNLEKQDLTVSLNAQMKSNEELSTVKAMLVSDKERLATENSSLSKKVNRASVVNVTKIDVGGYIVKSSGKEVEKNRAKNIEGLKICFDVAENPITEKGTEEFYIRIINPTGETQAIENLGSGTLVNQANNEAVKYTSSKGLSYDNKAQNTCMNWQPNIPFQAGKYTVEIYNKGYLSGASTFELK
ncbi:MAG: hypothetical protein ABI844_15995 [Saprospiraceae bacterium]